MLEVLDRFRNRGLQGPITNEVLERIGVSESLSPRTLYALQVLDLIDEAGMPTEVLAGLRVAPEAEYKKRLEDWLKAAYSEVFSFVDPAQDDEVRIRDAFRNYRPHGQQNRMVSLFTGLSTAAGLIPEKSDGTPRSTTPRPKTSTRRPLAGSKRKPTSMPERATGNLPPALAGLLASLPASGRWTQERRDRFVQTFESVLDYSITIAKSDGDEDEIENGGT
jgi:hypothetical protein